MDNEIINYLSKHIDLTKEMKSAILDSTSQRVFKKGTILLREGQPSDKCYFVLKGCIRSYYVKDGIERTTDFYIEEESVTPSAYDKNIPSKYFLECMEDTTVVLGTANQEAEVHRKFPALESLTRSFGDDTIAKQQEALAEFKMSSPEERYLSLIKNRPDLIQRVPQHQIASYLGIKPESLSRIRKRLAKSNARSIT